ncbi:cactin [Tachysurus ichikawai]
MSHIILASLGALELKGIGHLGEKELKERNKLIQEENRRELQKVKQLRLEREREKTMREQELEMLQREKKAEHFKTWAEQEDNFHLHQAKLSKTQPQHNAISIISIQQITDHYGQTCGILPEKLDQQKEKY